MKKFFIVTFSAGNPATNYLKIGIRSVDALSFSQAEEQFNQIRAEILKDIPDMIIEILQIAIVNA